jgi:SPOR domain
MRRSIVIFLCIFSGYSAWASDSSRTAVVNTLVVKKDSRIDVLAKQQAANNYRSLKPHIVKESGYRLQVISTQDRTEAFRLKGELLEKFPSEKTYLMFQAPFFRVRFGNFKTRAEAMEYREAFLSYLSKDIFVIKDIIEYMWYPEKPADETIMASNN